MKTDHSITKGYPYEGIISQERFKNRIKIILDRTTSRKKEDVTDLYVDPVMYPDYKPATWLQRLVAGKVIDFMEFRLFDYAEALVVAENQIQHMQEEQPFLPEDFGFVKTVGPKDIHDNPTSIYTSKYDDKVSIFQNDEEEYEWHLLRRVASNGTANSGGDSFTSTKLFFPNHRIAYAAFVALGVKVEEVKPQEQEIMRNGKEEMKEFTAHYDNGDIRQEWINLKAYDEEDARSRAKFIFETGEFGIEIADFDKITITTKNKDHEQ